jgi:hypothetical protein
MILHPEHLQVLGALNKADRLDGWPMCLTFAGVADLCAVKDRAVIRRSCRYLARRELAEYHRGLWTEDGDLAGAGYCITSKGQAVLKERHSPEEPKQKEKTQ